MSKLKIFTWHVHGSYLYYLSHIRHDIYIPVKSGRPARYHGKTPSYPWPDNIHEIDAEKVKEEEFDLIIYQHKDNYLTDQYEVLTAAQRDLPKIYIEHDPPREVPTDTRHHAAGTDCIIVHVTGFNALMWDNGGSRVEVIDHGVTVPETNLYTGALDKGIVVINNLQSRGRRLGFDLYLDVEKDVPLNIVGMNSSHLPGGIGEVPHNELPSLVSQYRFFFNPIRYTSLGLSILEAMGAGTPVIGLATTELVTVIQNEVNGFITTRVRDLKDYMQYLLEHPEAAKKLGENARATVVKRFSLSRFSNEWNKLIENVVGLKTSLQSEGAALCL